MPIVMRIPKKVTRSEIKSTIAKSPKFQKMMDKAVLAEFIYDYPVTVMTMIAL